MLTRNRCVCIASVVAALSVLLWIGVAWADDGSSVAGKMSPSELHQYLAKQKALALEKSWAALQERGLPKSISDNYDVKQYDITIRVNDTTESLHGYIGFTAEPTVAGVQVIEVDLFANLTVDSIVNASGALAYSRLDDVVTITLDRAYDPGETFEFDFWYNGQPQEAGLLGFDFAWYHGHRAISNLSSPYFAHSWWPCKDRLDDKVDIYRIQIEVDSGLYAASNGTLDSIIPGAANTRKFYYTENYPMATYLFCIAAAPFEVWQQDYVSLDLQDTMPVIYHVFPDLYTQSLTSNWAQMPDIIGLFAGIFGEYPYLDHKYAHASFLWGGGMEHQTCTFLIGDEVGFDIDLISHELAHQWWGDMVGANSFHHIWLKEGWASYSEAIRHLEVNGWEDYRDYMNDMIWKGAGTVWVDDTTDVWRIFDSHLTYDKAAWVVHMLRGVLGEAKFQQGIEAYYNSQYQYGCLSTEQFRDLWEEATGVELDWFFEEWIYGQYYPKFDFAYYEEPSDSGGYDLYVVVKQTQTTNIFHTPVDFYLNRGGVDNDTAVFQMYLRKSRFKVNSPGTISSITVDPAQWLIKDVTQSAWTMYITSPPDDISDGTYGVPYADTIEYRGGSGTNNVRVNMGALPPGLTINNYAIISGTPTDTGTFLFGINLWNSGAGASDQEQYTIHIGLPETCCTGPSRGNVDGSADDLVTMGDLTVLIDHLFVSYEPLPCDDAGNVDLSADGLVTMGDLTVMIDHLFVSYDPLPPCIVW